jgi:hypothetical protein
MWLSATGENCFFSGFFGLFIFYCFFFLFFDALLLPWFQSDCLHPQQRERRCVLLFGERVPWTERILRGLQRPCRKSMRRPRFVKSLPFPSGFSHTLLCIRLQVLPLFVKAEGLTLPQAARTVVAKLPVLNMVIIVCYYRFFFVLFFVLNSPLWAIIH